MLLDEFRIRIMIKKNAFKRFLVRVLKSWLGKLDEVEFKKCSIDKIVHIELAKFVPDNGRWYHVAVTVDYWIKLSENGVREDAGHSGIHVDGEHKLSFDQGDAEGPSLVLHGGENK